MKPLKIIILFVVVLSGCSQKYLADKEEELGGRRRSFLDVAIVAQDKDNLSLSLKVKDFIVVGDSVKAKEFINREDGRKTDILVASGMAIIYSGLLGSYYYVRSQDYLTDEVFETGCFISSVSCLGGLAMINWGLNSRSSDINSRRDFIKIDTICVDSMLIPNSEMEISVEKTNFKRTYWTDEDGNIELGFEEIIPEPTEADSVLNFIIQYEDLVDTVEVNIIKEEE
jgi:hypothetical protein